MDHKVQLRPALRDDLCAFYEFQMDEVSNAMAATFPRDEPTFLEHWEVILADKNITARAIEFDGVLAGYISCFVVEGRVNIGYWIDQLHWGKGIASSAVSQILQIDRRRPIFAQAARSNAGSLRVLEKSGFIINEYKHEPASDRYPACEVVILMLS